MHFRTATTLALHVMVNLGNFPHLKTPSTLTATSACRGVRIPSRLVRALEVSQAFSKAYTPLKYTEPVQVIERALPDLWNVYEEVRPLFRNRASGASDTLVNCTRTTASMRVQFFVQFLKRC